MYKIPSFDGIDSYKIHHASGAEAYKRDLPNAEVHFLDTGTDSSSQKLSGGILTFVQISTGSGSATINGFDIGGTTILLQNTGSAIGGGGTQGSKLGSDASSGNATFKQTATAATLVTPDGTDTFHAYYGKVASGIVQSASLIGVDHKGCAEQFMLTHRQL